MNYELAKKLKDAGFPQKGKGTFIDGEKCDICGYHCYYVPTLSELIEACGDKFQILYKESCWRALSDSKPFLSEPRSADYQSEGKTPEEAVVYFWLEFNKK